MPRPKLTNRQVFLRSLFMIIAIAIISWFFPHNETFRYEYEVGKPWRYGRLTAPYDFSIYRNDSVLQQMEDSLRRQIIPHYNLSTTIAEKALKEFKDSEYGQLPSTAANHLVLTLDSVYQRGILTGTDREILVQNRISEVVVIDQGQSKAVPTEELLSERQAYELIRQDSIFGNLYAGIGLQQFLRCNLISDTTAMRIEYARLRQQVSATSGMVVAETRIIDQGEIVTPQIYDILESYKREQQHRLSLASSETLMYLGRSLIIAIVLCSILLFFLLYRPWIYGNQNEVLVAVGAVVFMVILTSLADRYMVGAVYMVPIGIVTILISTFLGSRSAYYCHIVMVLLCSFIAPSHFEYLVIQCIVGMVIVFSLKDGLQDRRQLMQVSLLSAICYTGTYALYTLATEGSLTNISFPILSMMLINAVLLLLTYLIIYAMENLFGFMSGVTLVELCNLGRGKLLKLSQDAPGTFNHSLQVSNLAANAAEAIGANPALVRTGALYHDIGKLWNPQMYTENQHGENPHDKMSIEQSVEIIKRHVTEGIKIAEEEKLPHDIVDFIKTHHGASVVKYFYIKWCNEHPDEEPDEKYFTYPGPDPTTKEQAILMMADSIEAASKSLQEYSIKSITELVDRIIKSIIASGRLDNAKITLQEIQQCKNSFIQDLESINHSRIAYPELNKK